MFSAFSFGAVFFVYYYIAESKGLSDKEKKALYIPGSEFGRKLRPGEQMQDIGYEPVAKVKEIELTDR